MSPHRQSVTNEREWWTIAEAAAHLDVGEGTVRRYIREGLPSLLGHVHRDQVLAEYRRRILRQRATRAKPGIAGLDVATVRCP